MTNVTCAIIRDEDNKVLIVQRGANDDHPLKWEFPGGKLKEGESGEECIIREIREELSMEIVICGRLEPVKHDYGNKKINLIPYICDTLDELPFLTEHNDYRWVEKEELQYADLLDPDIIVAVEYNKNTEGQGRADVDIESDITGQVEDKELQNFIENMMSRQEAEFFASSALDNKAVIPRLLEYSVGSDSRLAFRASWTLSKVFDRYPEIIYPYIEEMVKKLGDLKNESVQRSFLRILSLADINKIDTEYHGVLADHCFSALNSGLSAVAIKAYSMEVLYRLALIYPGLIYELSSSINMLQAEGSGGVIARGRIILKKLADISSDLLSSQK